MAINNTLIVSRQAALIRDFLGDWPFIAHPLREKNQQGVNEEYARKLSKFAECSSFEQGGLQLVSASCDEGNLLCGLRKLTWDSEFFGFEIGRIEPLIHTMKYEISQKALQTTAETVQAIVQIAIKHNIKQLIASADPADATSIYALEEAGFRLKDTMNYHFFDTSRLSLERENIRARIAVSQDGPYLEDIALRCFGNRQYMTNRFNSDPQYPINRVAEMYKVWVRKSISGDRADIVMVVDCDDKPVGFLTGILPTPEQIELGLDFGDMGIGAVDPDFHRQGFFRIVHKELLLWFKERGVRYVLTRTALSTSGVNKNCVRHGSIIPCSPHTFHLNLTNTKNEEVSLRGR